MRANHLTGELVQVACIWEALARKVGNVHRYADFATTSLTDFLIASTSLFHPFHTEMSRQVGVSVELATEGMMRSVGQNTSLGIILAVAPLVATPQPLILRDQLCNTLSSLSVDDATRVYRAIRLANPGGLGDALEQDVHSEPTVTLLEAMKLAADRDLIARQYANGYADVFDLGVPAFLVAFEKFGCVEAAVIECQLNWMAAFPDSLIARKLGLAAAEDVQRRVQHVLSLGGLDTAEGRRAGVELDAHLRSNGNKLNPGTTADLVAACLFVSLRENKVKPSAPFRWNVPDWL
jgi:triphosphoribosyl-dephospho-CoA synthase